MVKRRVLIPLDGSDFSRQIIPHVIDHLGPEAYELVLMRVGEPQKGITGRPSKPISPTVSTSMYENERDIEFTLHPVYQSQEYESALSDLSDELGELKRALESKGYTASTVIRFGDPARSIVQYVMDDAIDLIAMTTHGRSGLQRLMAGSVASHVLIHSPVPVMLYRPSAGAAVHEHETAEPLAAASPHA